MIAEAILSLACIASLCREQSQDLLAGCQILNRLADRAVTGRPTRRKGKHRDVARLTQLKPPFEGRRGVGMIWVLVERRTVVGGIVGLRRKGDHLAFVEYNFVGDVGR